MSTKSLVLAAALAAILPTAAHADWQYTKWGMSPVQVVAASSGTAKTLPATPPAKEFGDVELAKAPYSASGLHFTAELYFKDGGLSRVALILDTDTDGAKLEDLLLTKYGKPDETVTRPFGMMKVSDSIWTSKGDRITFRRLYSSSPQRMVEVIYQPPQKDGAQGL